MKQAKPGLRQVCLWRPKGRADSRLAVPLTLCLVIGSSLLQGCAVGAALGLMGATTTTGVLTSDAVDGTPNEVETWSVSAIVKNEAEVYAGPGEEYSRIGTLKEGAEIRVVGQKGDWIECCCDQFKRGWVHYSKLTGT